ncbi:flagellar hook-length control protein FliK [Helicobacter pylori]|uniref:flagellar hook-length control protein FliK n=1 Tax=Helicobacter pylori TaxID=210 RepID=UPI000D396528|nr:flagellar hook-length control protein FliK [Helicobacter pylori]PUD44172.1 flagellar hook-length control protein FliK [Helicobacter pylori]WRG89227.1 flagellar hook-length control protein FliK [Helicobacter pylori]
MPSPVNPIHTNANALNSGAKNEVKDAKNAPKSASKDFSKILNQKISKDKTAPKESPNPNALKATPQDAKENAKEDAKALEKTPTLPHQHAQNPAKDQQAPTLKDWLNHQKTTASHEAQHETHEHETNPKTPNETLNKNEKKPNGVTSNAHQTNLASKNPITPTNHANNAIKNPTTPTHNAKDPKTLKDIQTLSQKHDLNASNIQAATTPENKNPLNASDHLALKTTQTPTNHTLAKNDAKNTANLSSVLQSLEKKESHNKEHANPSHNEKKTPPLKEALQMNAIKRDKTLSKKKSEKTPTKAQTTAPSIAPENAPKIPFKTPPLMPLIGANPPNDNIPTLLEKEETTKEASDNKEKTKETNSSAQSVQNTQASDKTNENKNIAPKETIKHFTQQLKQEIQEYKPPMSRISMDLFPKELGKVEVIIQKVGKNLKVSVISHNNSLQTFLDNQQDLKNSLNALGFEGVDLSFSQDSSKEQPKEQLRELFKEQESTPLKENALKSYQENTDHENKETSMQITLYA